MRCAPRGCMVPFHLPCLRVFRCGWKCSHWDFFSKPVIVKTLSGKRRRLLFLQFEMKHPDPTPSLSLRHLKVGYGGQQKTVCLFEDLNLSLYAGQLVCFMGPNGIGKSTLMRTIAGLQKPLSGKIHFHQFDEKQSVSRLISVVLTHKIVAFNMTVFEIVAFGRYPYLKWNVSLSPMDEDIINRSIAQVHIEHLAEKKVQELSDGQLQMVMIARALAQDTPIVLLDEPTAHLDLNNRVEIMKLLRRICRETNKAIMVSTHELDLALQVADSIWLTDLERNILTGIPEDLVLSGAFDAIFQFKGFNLKTGKIEHEAQPGSTVQLNGEGFEYLWTKNALERTGMKVTQEKRDITITVTRKAGSVEWHLKKQDDEYSFTTLANLLDSI
jgi:iron complex transport system ATP-binding protein